MSNNQGNQQERIFFVKQFVKGTKNNTGSILQLSVSSNTGDLMITLAPQNGFNGHLPIFDYNRKLIFSLAEEEITKVLALYKSRQVGNISFPHLNAKNPKTINFENSLYNDKLQFKLYVHLKEQNYGIGFFFNDDEAKVFLKNLEDSISLYNKMNAVLALRNVNN